MKQFKTYADSNGKTYTDTLENGKLVRRECREGAVLNIWEKKISAWLFTEDDLETGDRKAVMVPYPPSPEYPVVSLGGEEVQAS